MPARVDLSGHDGLIRRSFLCSPPPCPRRSLLPTALLSIVVLVVVIVIVVVVNSLLIVDRCQPALQPRIGRLPVTSVSEADGAPMRREPRRKEDAALLLPSMHRYRVFDTLASLQHPCTPILIINGDPVVILAVGPADRRTSQNKLPWTTTVDDRIDSGDGIGSPVNFVTSRKDLPIDEETNLFDISAEDALRMILASELINWLPETTTTATTIDRQRGRSSLNGSVAVCRLTLPVTFDDLARSTLSLSLFSPFSRSLSIGNSHTRYSTHRLNGFRSLPLSPPGSPFSACTSLPHRSPAILSNHANCSSGVHARKWPPARKSHATCANVIRAITVLSLITATNHHRKRNLEITPKDRSIIVSIFLFFFQIAKKKTSSNI